MSRQTLAKRYASALFELTKGDVAATEAAAKSLLNASQSTEFKAFLNNPTLSRAAQATVLKALIPAGALQQFVERVALNRRLPLLPDIAAAYVEMCEASRGEVRVSVDSATPFNEQEASALAQAIGKVLGKAVHITVHTVPELLGGVRLKIGNSLIDYSAAAKLERLKQQLKNSPLGA